MDSEYKLLPIECLTPGRFQPRQIFDEASLQELAQSIRSQGLIEPLIVREITHNQYEIIAGERRWRAGMLANCQALPCLIRPYSDEQAAAVSLIENIQRQDLNLLEEAQGYQRLLQEFHFHQHDIAQLVGKSRSHIANILRLLTLSPPIQERLKTNQLSLGHARMLVGLSPQQQAYFAQRIEQNNWSVRRLEEEVKRTKINPVEELSSEQDSFALQNRLSEYLGTPVYITSNSDEGGWLKIKFFDNDTLTGLLERMGLRYD